jgi:hypothetical protein
MKKWLLLLGGVGLVGVVGAGLLSWRTDTTTITRTSYQPPRPEANPLVGDDRPPEKATSFDPTLWARRPRASPNR